MLRRTPPDPALREDPAAQAAYLSRDAVTIAPQDGLARQLARGRPLTVKLGLDPTAPDIHLGHTIVLRKLREFQLLGHDVVLIVGDYTARIGDPSGRSRTRPSLAPEQIEQAAATYAQQAFRLLDARRTALRFNAEWLATSGAELLRLARAASLAQVLERDDFAQRMAARAPLSLLELMYPLVQGYDSVAIGADVEIGATDQTFNMLLARDVQRHYGVEQQTCIAMPILSGVDGTTKMSKSLGNYIGVAEPPDVMRAKALQLPHRAVADWCRLLFEAEPSPSQAPHEQLRSLADAIAEQFGRATPPGGLSPARSGS